MLLKSICFKLIIGLFFYNSYADTILIKTSLNDCGYNQISNVDLKTGLEKKYCIFSNDFGRAWLFQNKCPDDKKSWDKVQEILSKDTILIFTNKKSISILKQQYSDSILLEMRKIFNSYSKDELKSIFPYSKCYENTKFHKLYADSLMERNKDYIAKRLAVAFILLEKGLCPTDCCESDNLFIERELNNKYIKEDNYKTKPVINKL